MSWFKKKDVPVNQRILDLEKKFERKIVVDYLIGDSASRLLNIYERRYIGTYIMDLEEDKV